MSWPAELLHVFRRDLRRTRWPLLGYLGALLIAIAIVTETLVPSGRIIVGGQTVMLLAPLLVAMTVLADSTMRVDAFWAVQPLRTSVVIASKLLYVLLLLALCAVAILVVLSAWQLHVSSANAVSAASFAVFALLLLGTALIATACANLVTVGLVLGVTFMLVLAGTTLLLTKPPHEIGIHVWTGVTCLMAIGGAALFVGAYRQVWWSPMRRGLMMFSGMGLVAVPTLMMGEHGAETTAVITDRAAQRVAIRVPLVRQLECSGDRVIVPVEITSPTTWRVELMRPSVVLTLVDGTHATMSSERWMASVGIWGPMVPGTISNFERSTAANGASTRVRRTDIAFEVSRDVATRVCGRVASATFRVQMRASSGVELMRLALDMAGTVSAPGYRAQIEAAQVSDTGVAIDVRVAMLGAAMAGRLSDLGNLDFALLHRDQRTLLRLHDDESTDRVNVGVLPGLRRMSRQLRLQRYRSDAERPPDLRSWQDSAVLLVIAPVWQATGERVVTATMPVAVAGTPTSH